MIATKLYDPLLGIEGRDQHDSVKGGQIILLLVQLHQMLGAMQSTEPAKKDDHNGLSPERRQCELLPIRVGHCEIGSDITYTQRHP